MSTSGSGWPMDDAPEDPVGEAFVVQPCAVRILPSKYVVTLGTAIFVATIILTACCCHSHHRYCLWWWGAASRAFLILFFVFSSAESITVNTWRTKPPSPHPLVGVARPSDATAGRRKGGEGPVGRVSGVCCAERRGDDRDLLLDGHLINVRSLLP